MPLKTKWMLDDMTIPQSSWNFADDIESATLKIESEFSISIKKSEPNTAHISLITKIDFLKSRDDTESMGNIETKCSITVTSQVNLVDLEQGDPEFAEFARDMSHVLFGANRAEVMRISLMAGLGTPVLLPISEIDGEEFKMKVS